MGVYTGEYSLFNVFICASPYAPSGICYPEGCLSGYLTLKTEDTGFRNVLFSSGLSASAASSSFTGENISVTVYLSGEDDGGYSADLFLLPDGRDASCLVSGLSCTAVADAESDTAWERDGSSIRVKFPQIRSCGLTSLKTVHRAGVVTVSEMNGRGEITVSYPVFTNNRDGYLDYSVPLTTSALLPGMKSVVYYRMEGHDEDFYLGSYSFQTDIFTSAGIVGCGLTERLKIYDDPTDPDSGYSYAETPVEGGIGHVMNDDWLFDTRLRWCVEYYGKNYWLKSAYPCRLSNGTRIGILKSANSLPYTPETEITSSMAETELSETNDRIVPEYFY